ncbi:hypothetical protein KSS87_003905 [Heliosperma pusillum]|nr:hypothetical protein KSS87_003905 [Heliosperma pusillum]
MQQWVIKQGRLIVHTRSYNVTMGNGVIVHTKSYNATMGNEARKTHCTDKELQCKQVVMKQGRLNFHTRSYNANNG